MHALLIDDDTQALHIMEQALKQQQMACTCISNPTSLEAILPTLDPVDVVFLDLEMPSLDGYEVFTILKRLLDPRIPIVACSIHTSELHNTRRNGFFGFIAKPLDVDRVPNFIERILGGDPVWDVR